MPCHSRFPKVCLSQQNLSASNRKAKPYHTGVSLLLPIRVTVQCFGAPRNEVVTTDLSQSSLDDERPGQRTCPQEPNLSRRLARYPRTEGLLQNCMGQNFLFVLLLFAECTPCSSTVPSLAQGTTKRTTRQGLLRAQTPLLYAMTYFWNVQGTEHSKVGDITDPYTFLRMVRLSNLLDGHAKTERAVWTAPPLPKYFSSSAVDATILTV